MKTEVTVTINAKLPASLLREFLQTYRTFGAAHFDCDELILTVAVDAPTLKAEQLEEMFRTLKPPCAPGITITIRREEV